MTYWNYWKLRYLNKKLNTWSYLAKHVHFYTKYNKSLQEKNLLSTKSFYYWITQFLVVFLQQIVSQRFFNIIQKFYILTAEAVLETSFTILESAVKSVLNGHDDMPQHVWKVRLCQFLFGSDMPWYSYHFGTGKVVWSNNVLSKWVCCSFEWLFEQKKKSLFRI